MAPQSPEDLETITIELWHKYSTDDCNTPWEHYHCSLLDIPEESHLSINQSLHIASSFYSSRFSYHEFEHLKSWDKNYEKLAFRSPLNFLYGIASLLILVASDAAIAPLVLALPAKSPFIGMAWRNQSAFLILLPVVVKMYTGGTQRVFLEDFHPRKLAKSAIAGLLLYLWLLGLVLACQNIVNSHASILHGSTGIFIFLVSLITCRTIHKYEILGYIAFFIGIPIMVSDPLALKTEGGTVKIYGILLGLTASAFGALYLYFNEKHSKSLHPFVLIFQMFFFICLIQIAVCPLLLPSHNVISLNLHYGVFGWMSDFKITCLMLLLVAPVTSIACNYFYMESFKYWPLEIVSIAILTGPIFGEFFALILGQDEMPGIQTIIGLTVISIGMILAMQGAKIKSL